MELHALRVLNTPPRCTISLESSGTLFVALATLNPANGTLLERT